MLLNADKDIELSKNFKKDLKITIMEALYD